MKPLSPHDPLDDLIAASLHGELTAEERTAFETRLAHDPAARAAYHDAQLMHDLLEKTHQSAQPDPAFEQRMVSGVRRKLQNEEQGRETPWQSVLVLWNGMKRLLRLRHLTGYAVILGLVSLVALSTMFSLGHQVKGVFTTISSELAYASPGISVEQAQHIAVFAKLKDTITRDRDKDSVDANRNDALQREVASKKRTYMPAFKVITAPEPSAAFALNVPATASASPAPTSMPPPVDAPLVLDNRLTRTDDAKNQNSASALASTTGDYIEPAVPTIPEGGTIRGSGMAPPTQPQPAAAPAPDDRKLIRNAQLDLEVKSFQSAIDQITALTRAAGGYVDTSNSQKGGNGKLQGTIVVKVLPQNLDGFLLKLRDLGETANQSVSTEDVTKDYYDTQARLENSRKMEIQLQDLLKRENGKVSDLLQVEHELSRVRGEIEQMQGSLKLYDFQVAHATVTLQLHEKDLNQAAAYLLKEQDNFALFATDVEDAFQKARQTADTFKAQILQADLNHNSGSDVSAELIVMVAPDQIESFLAQIRSLGRVANFTRETQRVAKDGGDSDHPADETLTEKDKVQVHISIRSDDETRKQVALTVVMPDVDTAFEQAKTAALADVGVEIMNSSLNRTPEGQSSARLTVRVPGKTYDALLQSFRALGRSASFSLQRDDDSGPGANGDDAPVIISLCLTNDETPLQQTEMTVLASNVDNQARQLKKDAASAGVEVRASSYARQPDGTETAQLVFRMSMAQYPAFLENLKKLGKVESLTVQRDDHPDQARTDDSAPVDISLTLHNQGDVVPDDNGLWATLRQTFGEGIGALFASVKVIGVLIAFIVPWLVTIALLAWLGRRIYLWKKK